MEEPAGKAPCYLVQILLPTHCDDQSPIADEAIEAIKDELIRQFGGVTAFTRLPAKGVWAPGAGKKVQHDDVVIVEVMTSVLDETWWRAFRKTLERDLKQETAVMRAQNFKSL